MPIGPSRRRWLNQFTHRSVANSTASSVCHRSRRPITSVLYSQSRTRRRIIVRIAATADRRGDAGVRQALRGARGQILHPTITRVRTRLAFRRRGDAALVRTRRGRSRSASRAKPSSRPGAARRRRSRSRHFLTTSESRASRDTVTYCAHSASVRSSSRRSVARLTRARCGSRACADARPRIGCQSSVPRHPCRRPPDEL